jgi:hypothetical protein
MNIIEAIHNDKLFKPVFKDLSTWSNWLVLLSALFNLPMDETQLKIYRRCTGRQKPPEKEFREFWGICGRRGGKSFIAAVVAVFLALFFKYEKHLSPGERGTIQIIAADRSQAQVILSYTKGILQNNPVFAQYIVNDFKESIDLSNSISIEVMSCSYRSIRGRTVVACICDEIAFWMHEGEKPDREILAAIRPSMATIPNSKLIVISSPYSRSGVLYEHWEQYYGKEDPNILIWRAPTTVMNPTIPQELIDAEMKKDKSSASSEWYAEWRSDIEGFLDPDLIKACAVLPGDLAPQKYQVYSAFCDPSGGRADAFSLAIGSYHYESEKYVVDLLKAWPAPFNPSEVVAEAAAILKRYRCRRVVGDRYSGEWCAEAFQKNGVIYERCELSKSKLYLEFEPLVNTQQIQIPKDKNLINELLNLERRTGRSGRDSVDHPPRGSDDLANSVAGVTYLLTRMQDSAFAGCDLT